MAILDPKQNKSWPELLGQARQAETPPVDVTAAVLAELRARPRQSAGTQALSDEVAALFGWRWLKPAFAALLLAAGGLAYEGYRSSDAVSLLFEFSL